MSNISSVGFSTSQDVEFVLTVFRSDDDDDDDHDDLTDAMKPLTLYFERRRTNNHIINRRCKESGFQFVVDQWRQGTVHTWTYI
jgi:hypothetical protein